MDWLASAIKRAHSWHVNHWAHWLLAGAIFFTISVFYMGGAISQCRTFTPAYNSDTTGGIAWFQWASGNRLTWGFTNKSNYPIGEQLNRPQFITSATFDIPYRLLSAMTTPICGVNLMILLAYMSTALAMYGLIKWLFQKVGIAYFAGFAAAFVPYHQLKSESHVVYMFSSIFILIIWAYLWYVQKPQIKKLALLALLSAIGIYFDGYFILLTAVLVTTLLSLLLIRRVVGLFDNKGKFRFSFHLERIWQNIIDHIRPLIIFLLLLIALLSPIAYVQIKHRSEISKALSTSRGNINAEAKSYGTRLPEYILPSFNNPLMPKSYQNWRLAHQHGSNPSEDTVYVGIVIVILALIALAQWFNPANRKIQLKNNISYGYFIVLIGILTAVAVLLSLESKFTFLGLTFITPVDLIIKLTTKWRVFSRFFLLADPLIIILAASGLYILTRKWPIKKYVTLLVACSVVLFVEYLTFPPKPGADIYKDSPQVYQRIAKDSSVHVVAEYPFVDLVTSPTTFTFQQIYNKPLLNANDATIEFDNSHQSIAGLNDAQTIPVLKAKGVDLITTVGINEENNPSLIPYTKADTTGKGVQTIFSYRISNSVRPNQATLVPVLGFNQFSIDALQISHRVLAKDGTMNIEELNPTVKKQMYVASFKANSLVGMSATLTIKQADQLIWFGNFGRSPATINFNVSSHDTIYLSSTQPIDVNNMIAQKIE